MFRDLFRGLCRRARVGLQATPSGRGRARQGLPALERLEAREVLTLAAPTLYTVGTTTDGFIPNAAPINVISADLNGDGKADLIETHNSDNSVNVLLGNGDGTFRAPIRTAVGEAIEGCEYVGDFNNDGKLDVFLPSNASGNPAIVLLGNGDGTFQSRIDSSSFAVSGYYPRGWTVGDFNGDGKLDVAATLPNNSANSGRYTVLLGNGDGTFQAGIVGPAVLGYARWVTAGDFNGDGKLDLATADGQQINGSSGNAEMTILLGNGDGTFTLKGHFASPGTPDSDNLNPEGVTVGDLNGDGKLDAIVSDYDANINVFLGNGDGSFQPAIGIEPGEYPRSVDLADVNRDGKVDLVVTDLGIGAGGAEFAQEGYKPGSVAVLMGNGDGTFQAPISYSPFDYPGWTAVGDFNGDGAPDLATSQVFDGHSLAVMLNDPSSANLPPALTGDPTASSGVVTGTTVNLSASASDDGGAANLKYTWGTVVAPPAGVSFSANGTNAAANTTVTFHGQGTYYFEVTATDAAGLSTIGTVKVTVNSVLSSVSVTPGSATVTPSGTQQFSAVARDQFGNALSSQPSFAWAVSGGGSINSGGLFTAGSTAGGPFSVTATTGGVSGGASVTVAGSGPSVWTGLGSTNNWSDAANWSTGVAPGSGATVVFNATSSKDAVVDASFAGAVSIVQINSGYGGTVSLSRNLIVAGAFTEAAGAFSAGVSTLFVGGDLTATGGTFSAGTGAVSFDGSANQNVSANGVQFANVTLANASGHSLNVNGTLTVNGVFTWLRTAGYILGPNGSGNASIECRGDVDDQNHGGTGNPYFLLDGGGDQAIEDTSGVANFNGLAGGDFRGLSINKASGNVVLQCYPVIYNGLSLLRGGVNTNGYWWLVTDTGGGSNIISTASGTNLGDVTLAGNLGAAMSRGLQVRNLTLSGHTFTAPSSLSVSGNWDGGGSGSAFTANGGTVFFDAAGGTQTLDAGASHFYNVTHSGAGTLQLVNNNLSVDGGLVNSGGPIDLNGHVIVYAVPPPRVTASSVSGSVSGPVSSIRLTFNTSIDPSTFTLADLTFTGPNGAITVASVTAVAGSNNTQFDVSFAPQSASGGYSLVVGPDVRNVRGTAMDQNNNGIPGEASDAFTLSFTIV
jgi:hypothetical protein